MTDFRIILDADPVVYRCGFAAQKHSYELVVGNPMEQMTFENGDTLRQWKRDNKADEDSRPVLGQIMHVDAGTEQFALQMAGTNMRAIVRAVKKQYKLDDFPSVLTLLGGEGNFRDDIGTVKAYKGNRAGVVKPVWYEAIRGYLVRHWSAKVIDGREADDECGIIAQRYREDGVQYVIATIDKDLDQIPGEHYDYDKKVFYNVDPDEAEQLFWKQVLSGDTVDNVPGATKVGAKTAERLVNEWYASGMESADIWAAVVEVYNDSKRHESCLYTGLDAKVVALEMARLVFMQNYPGILWTPPGVEEQYLKVQLDD